MVSRKRKFRFILLAVEKEKKTFWLHHTTSKKKVSYGFSAFIYSFYSEKQKLHTHTIEPANNYNSHERNNVSVFIIQSNP